MNTEGGMIVVWFSCGAASAIAIQETIRQYGGDYQIRVVNSPIAEEDDDNRRFLKDIEKWLGVDVEIECSEKFPSQSAEEVWEKRRFMSGPHGAPCTKELKKEARYQWERRNNPDWHVLGFTMYEVDRFERFKITERENILPVLIDAKIPKVECYMRLAEAGIQLPRMYKLGYPNANCIGCVKATSPTYWNHVRRVHPEVFRRRSEQSRDIGSKLVRHEGKRIFLDELPTDSEGQDMKSMDLECGIFCEEQ